LNSLALLRCLPPLSQRVEGHEILGREYGGYCAGWEV
jgi:hypothetical protein